MNGRHSAIAFSTIVFTAVLCAGRAAYGNEPPVADAGLPRYAATAPVTLDGTGSYDPDNSGPLTYAWRQTSGPPLAIKGADTATPTISGFVFVQTAAIQGCVFELAVSDGELTSAPDSVTIMIVPAFTAGCTMTLENPVFDPQKPTVIFFGGGTSEQTGGGRLNDSLWSQKANIISFPSYVADPGTFSGAQQDRRYERPGDMVIVYLSEVAPAYRHPVETFGWSIGGLLALDVARCLNLTYADARYAVNHATLIDPSAWVLGTPEFHRRVADLLANPVDGEQCWVQSLEAANQSVCPSALNVVFVADHALPWNWYRTSLARIEGNAFNHGLSAGAYWSVVGPGRNLQLALTPEVQVYKFRWTGTATAGELTFYDQSVHPGLLPEPVTLLGPSDGASVGADGAVLSCRSSQNAVRYQILFGRDPFHMIYLAADGPTPPDKIVTAFPFQKTWWTIKAHDQYGSTIYADPACISAESVTPQTIENSSTGQIYASIQEALNDAHEGDEIVLGAGVWQYLGNLDFKGKRLTLRSADPNDPCVVGATVIRGDGRLPVVTLSSGTGEPPTLDGLTITGGTVGISCRDARPTIRNCTVGSNGPVAIEFWYGGEPKLVDCTVLGQVTEGSDSSLIAHWKLDETAGTTALDSVGGNDATVVGTPLWQPEGGKVGGALQLSGAPNLIRTKLVRNPAKGPVSVLAWVKGGAPGQVIVSQAGGANWLTARAGTGALTTELRQAGPTGKPLVSSTVITDGNWHRVCLVWGGSNRILCVDEVEVARDTQANVAGSTGNLSIGAGSTMAPASFWKGLIDDVQIYDRAVKP